MRTSRKRHFVVAFLAAAVTVVGVLASSSLGSNLVRHRFEAPLQGGVNNAGLEFNAFFKKGDGPRYVTDLVWQNLLCPTGSYIPYPGVQHWNTKVNKRGKFHNTHAVKNGGGASVTIAGKFTRKHGKVHVAGTFKLTNLPSCPGGTGKLDWKTGGGGSR